MADYNFPQQNREKPDKDVDEETGYFTIRQLKEQYYDFLAAKSAEIDEGKESGRYYHGAQWTDKEIKALKRRRQPVITSNRIVRKIDAVVGLVERLKQDPKAYPRTPKSEDGAEIATAVLRYCLDHVQWDGKSPRIARHAAISGFSGIELDLAYGDHGDPDIDAHIVYPDTYFYDPRSFDDGFTDVRYHGISKWVDIDQAKELVPDKADELDELVDTGTDMTINSDREMKWINTAAKRIRMIDHWYIQDGRWRWCLYASPLKLMEGDSPYFDERGKSFSKFLMFSCGVDHDGDRYGFVRNLKGPQDEINHRRSKGLHILNSRRLILEKGSVDDVERTRQEWARPDGVLEINPGKKAITDPQQADFAGQLQMLQEAKNEIENFGPNPALIGQGVEGSSGRAISLLQQAGIAELGPYIIAYRTWKMRVYRAIWNIVCRFWTAERWIRVTDDEGVAQFIQINGLTTDQYGQPAIANHLGSLDVDIIIDEGPDNINMMADAYDTLIALVRGGQAIPPNVLIELAPLQNSVKQKLLKQMEAAAQDPQKQQAKQVALASEAAKVGESKSKAFLNLAQGQKALIDAHISSLEQEMALQGIGAPPLTQPPAGGAPVGAGPPPAPGGPVPGPVGGAPMPPSPQEQQTLPFPGGIPPGALAR